MTAPDYKAAGFQNLGHVMTDLHTGRTTRDKLPVEILKAVDAAQREIDGEPNPVVPASTVTTTPAPNPTAPTPPPAPPAAPPAPANAAADAITTPEVPQVVPQVAPQVETKAERLAREQAEATPPVEVTPPAQVAPAVVPAEPVPAAVVEAEISLPPIKSNVPTLIEWASDPARTEAEVQALHDREIAQAKPRKSLIDAIT